MENVRVVVASARLATVDDDTDETVLGVASVLKLLAFFVLVVNQFAVYLGQTLHRVRLHVDLTRKLELVVEFDCALAENMTLYDATTS